MLDGDQRYCDVCAEPIPRGTPYRCGYTTPAAVTGWFDGDPSFLPTFTPEPDGTVRIDVCAECAGESQSIRANSQSVVDPLH